jgi:hypothetical protein
VIACQGCLNPPNVQAAIEEVRAAAKQVDAAVQRLTHATAGLAAAMTIEKVKS